MTLAPDDRPVTIPLSEVISVFVGFWFCHLCSRPDKPGAGRYWDTGPAAFEAGVEHLRVAHRMVDASKV